jgi:hypothetical protein
MRNLNSKLDIFLEVGVENSLDGGWYLNTA